MNPDPSSSFAIMQRFENPLNDRLGVFEYLVVPEPNDTISFLLEPLRAPCIRRFLFGVLPTIELDDDMSLEANEVDDERADRRLSTEAMAIQLATSELRP